MMNKQLKELKELFNGDISEWMMFRLPKYLDKHFDDWVLNPISKNQVEVFVSGFEDIEYWELEEDMQEEAIYMAIDLIISENIAIRLDDVLELVLDYALESFYVHPIAELGDEPIADDDKLLFSGEFFE